MALMFNVWVVDFLFELKHSTDWSLRFPPVDGGPIAAAGLEFLVLWFCHPEYEVILPSSESFPVPSRAVDVKWFWNCRDDKFRLRRKLHTLCSVTVTFLKLELFLLRRVYLSLGSPKSRAWGEDLDAQFIWGVLPQGKCKGLSEPVKSNVLFWSNYHSGRPIITRNNT